MDDLARQYDWTRTWFEYANGQTYGSNGWAIAAAFALFAYVMKDAKDELAVLFGTGAAVFLLVFVGFTSAGWADERDAAYSNLVRLEVPHEARTCPASAVDGGPSVTPPVRPEIIVTQTPNAAPQTQRTGTFGSRPLSCTIYLLTLCLSAGFISGAVLRLRSLRRARISDGPKGGAPSGDTGETPAQTGSSSRLPRAP